MAIYTVHEPPRRAADLLAHTERFCFVRDGFSWGAFLFGPLWMVRHRMWLVLVLYLIASAALGGALRVSGASSLGMTLGAGLLALLVGMEASTLRRWTLGRRGWVNRGVVVGDDLEAAERRFFDAWINDPEARRFAAVPVTRSAPAATTHDVIGLFPEPGGR
jgi:hypothetical protein